MKGKVKFYNDMKNFGFIAGEDGKEYFVHQTGLKEGVTLQENDAVAFDVEEGERGPKAVNVAKADAAEGEATEDAPAEEEAKEETSEETEESPEEANEEPSEEEPKEE